ncbi:hypothetical protein SARC_09973 [Sphaeroforma arctica JP610]|uniref:TH1 protein n=1 Tax=Sphaeroforma arctica JP610 TaxID=667725 RepID=A0A0L0FLF1_9EUKA|nr:hypothetical protein SARC_09973 [Sphaeroforma arctica JP610]KNC77570.1 hypothetical protein SARC_09973 [Sphaeroforma arctica JP610]|eukprot:XP_014151472.1 hypothetical protein SARC_09973 [Sphaeroforma arctica JP610]
MEMDPKGVVYESEADTGDVGQDDGVYHAEGNTDDAMAMDDQSHLEGVEGENESGMYEPDTDEHGNPIYYENEDVVYENSEAIYDNGDGLYVGDEGPAQSTDDDEGMLGEEHFGDDSTQEERELQRVKQQDEYSNLLKTTDALMEPKVSEWLIGYLRSGGAPPDAIGLLSNNYRGLAQMANLMSEWLMITGVPQEEIESTFDEYVRGLILQYFNSKEADSILTQMKDDEFPPWLEELISYPQWRQLIADLTERHHESYFLKYMVQKISDAGYQSEMLNVATASRNLEVFSRVLVNQLGHILSMGTSADAKPETHEQNGDADVTAMNGWAATPETAAMKEAIADFVKTACYTGSTYLFTQALLHKLMVTEDRNSRERNTLRRLSQEVEKYAKDNEHNVLHLSLLLTGCATLYPEVAVSVNGLLMKGEVNPADMLRLHKAYTTTQHSQTKAPPLQLVQLPKLIEIIIDTLFDAKKKLLPAHRSAYISFLALLVSGHTDENGGYNHTSPRVKATADAIEKTVGVCQKTYIVWSDPEPVKVILDNLQKFPVLAPGVLKWIRDNLADSDYFVSNFSTGQVPIHLAILDRVAKFHPHTCPQVFELVRTTFERSDLGLQAIVNMEMKKILIDRMIHIMTCGYVLEVIQYLVKNPPLDHTLQRYAVAEIMSTIGPPYSLELVDQVLDLVETVIPVLHSTSAARTVVVEFTRTVTQKQEDGTQVTTAPLTDKIAQRVADLEKLVG